ncbi:MAG: PQQ-dependent sugar dehydrogenase [bacterium]
MNTTFLSLLFLLPNLNQDVDLELFQMPAGFEISIYAEVPGARSLELGPPGVVYVGNRRGGTIHAVIDKDQDGLADAVMPLIDDLDMPNGIEYHEGSLYIAENHRIRRFDDAGSVPKSLGSGKIIAELPDKSHHGWRYMGMGPDGYLYYAIGAPCNICNEPGFATIERIRPDGSDRSVYAEGVRNSVGFDWHPQTGELWFTDNGRDWMGDDLPPDEINRASIQGQHFGYPYCHGSDTADPEFGKERSCAEFIPPVQLLGAHVAPLGIHFYTGNQFPSKYRTGAFVAEHGSWNRSEKVGYRLMFLELEGDRIIAYRPFVTGWLDEIEGVIGRPVDVLTMPDGAILVSDDKAGRVYRITYKKPAE